MLVWSGALQDKIDRIAEFLGIDQRFKTKWITSPHSGVRPPASSPSSFRPRPWSSPRPTSSGRPQSQAWSAERVMEDTKDRVVASRGDPGNTRLVLTESTVQFWQYRGQTFKWLLTMGYAVMVLAAHQRERKGGETLMFPAMANKDALVQYASLFHDVTRTVGERRTRDGSSSPGREDHRLDGFGEHQSVSYRDLYEGKDREKRSYVQWIQRQKVRPGSKMEALQKYIQRRDVKEIAVRRRALCLQPSEFHNQQLRIGKLRGVADVRRVLCSAAGRGTHTAGDGTIAFRCRPAGCVHGTGD
ncbi:hypothetical protein P4O66_018139 [Electrophorus voltai]|uniref:Uncharacterized protein n=1 Tax=Electrophorus voltai TaxID=2609070 RepID=A0AAD9DL18_9TELE|nr:hypothetical protein P4O66_018139 [Electrophorus voltai]